MTKQMRGQERNGEWKQKNKIKMRLGKRNARDRARLISQMPVDKKIRLEKRKVTLANESCEQRDARLEHMRTLQQQRLEVETPEQRDAGLEGMRQRLEAETPEQRDARLEHMRTLQQQRLEV